MDRLIRFPLIALLVLVVTFATFAFASSQSGEVTGGEGMNSVSGYDVSNIHYQLADDASRLAMVEFDLNAPADVVKANLNSSSEFIDCRNTSGYHWVCTINSSVKVSEMNELKVIATGS